MICAPKRKAVGSNPAGEAKASDPQLGVACFIFIKGIRTPAGVNRAPVEPESRGQGLRRSAGRIPPPRGGILPEDSLLQSRALSEPAGECEDPAGEALFAAAQVISKKRSPDGSVLDRKHRGEERIRCPAVRRRPSAHRPFRVPARAWPALCPTARPPGRSCSRSSRSPGTSPYSQSAPAARRGIPA